MMNEIIPLITNVGFPIFACVMLFQQQKELNKTLSDLTVVIKTIEDKLDNKKEV